MFLCVILEPEKEKEEGMALNLRAGFKEKQRKRLFEALSTAPPPAKRTSLEVSHEEPVLDAPTTQVPPSDIIRYGQELVVNSSAEKNT